VAYLHGRGFVHGDISPANVRCDHERSPRAHRLWAVRTLCLRCPEPPTAWGSWRQVPQAPWASSRPRLWWVSAAQRLIYSAWSDSVRGMDRRAAVRCGNGCCSPSHGRPAAGAILALSGPAADWDALLGRLLAVATEKRPASARDLLREIRRILPTTSLPSNWAFPCRIQPVIPLAGFPRRPRQAGASTLGAAGTTRGRECPGRRGNCFRSTWLRPSHVESGGFCAMCDWPLLSQTLPPFTVDERGLAGATSRPARRPPASQLPLGMSHPFVAGSHGRTSRCA